MEGTKIVPHITRVVVLTPEALPINVPTKGDQDLPHA